MTDDKSCKAKSMMPVNDFDCHKIIDVAEMFLSEEFTNETYQKITDIARQVVSAKYAIFNLYEDNGEDYYSVAVSGTGEVINKASKMLGFEISRKKWGADPHKAMKIANATITCFETLHDLTGKKVPLPVMLLIEKSFNLGKTYVAKIVKDQKMLGDFTLVYESGEEIVNEGLMELFVKLTGLFVVRKKAEEKLALMASTDELTGLWNRRYFFEIGNNECKRTRRYKAKFGMLMIDIDHFKIINDTHGHGAGDAVLRSVAQIFKDGLRDVDIPARIGGEEFAVLMPHTDIDGVKIVAERLRSTVESLEVVYEGTVLKVTISLGISDCTNVSSIDEMLKNADDALYVAKEAGRNCFKVYKG
jgi:diguanylate cyclase (GGDEF)-like protein